MRPIIEIKNLSKKYRLRETQSYYSLRDSLTNFLKNPFKSMNQKKEDFWALKDFSLSIFPGEIIGIIGNNGAGKSTLLKILSRITPPTTGKIILRGRVASLLEVGTGFHPELTGRENIYLNGTILGMSKKEISAKFDEIVAFSELEQFLDTPVKHYSSGMYTRLAFAVAAHLDPDILIVDEVLSVGDAAFQKKSLGKMRDVSKRGMTVLFVSHNLPAITTLCQKVVLLKKGKISKIGNPEEVVGSYLKIAKGIMPEIKFSPTRQITNGFVQIIGIRVRNEEGRSKNSFDIRKPIGIDIEFRILKTGVWFACNIQVKNETGIILFNSPEDNNLDPTHTPRAKGDFVSTCWIPGNFLSEGVFTVRVSFGGFTKRAEELELPDIVSFNIHDNLEGGSVRGKSTTAFPGVLRPKLKWERHLARKKIRQKG